MPSLAVLGPGGVGGFLAGAVARVDEDVVVVARESTAELINRQGLQVRSVRLGDFRAHPRAVSTLERGVDTLIVTTKATTLDSAIGRVVAAPGVVVPLLNGLDHMAMLRDRFGRDRVAAGAIRIESDRPRGATVVQTSPFLRVDLASDDPRLRGVLHELAGVLERASVPAELGSSEAQILWSKLVRLNALALTTSAYDVPVGIIRTDHRAELEACINEAAAVANVDGARIDPRTPLQELDDAHPELGSSMQRDIAAGREPELDAIAGSVLRAAARHGIECPTIARLAAQVAQRVGIAAPRPHGRPYR
jgi:2-dehydropantoate 2-reductase